jgi:hypothetical protein
MSTIGDILSGVQDILTLKSDVKRLGDDMVDAQRNIRDHDTRIVRIETFIEIGQRMLLPPR